MCIRDRIHGLQYVVRNSSHNGVHFQPIIEAVVLCFIKGTDFLVLDVLQLCRVSDLHEVGGAREI